MKLLARSLILALLLYLALPDQMEAQPSNAIGMDEGTASSPGIDMLWARQFERPTEMNGEYDVDEPRVMVVDSDGSAYLAMRSVFGDLGFGVMKIDRFGRELWRVLLGHIFDDPCCAAIGADGLLRVAGSAYSGQIDGRRDVHLNYLIAGIHSASGRIVWRDTLDGDGEDDWPHGVVLTPSDDFIVAGWSQSSRTGNDGLAVAYDAAGLRLWRQTYDASDPAAPYPSSEEVVSVAGGVDGSIYLGGLRDRSMLVLAYDANGGLQWSASHRPAFARSVQDVEMDDHPEGGVVMAGRAWVGEWSHDDDVVTARFDEAGSVRWSSRWTGSTWGENRPLDVAVDRSGSSLVLIQTRDTVSSAVVLLKYDAAGTLIWELRFEHSPDRTRPGLLRDFPVVMSLDEAGAAYIAGTVAGDESWRGPPLKTWKVASDGSIIWEVAHTPDAYYREQPRAVSLHITPRGDVYLLASVNVSSSPYYGYTRPLLIRYIQGQIPDDTPPPIPEPSLAIFPMPASRDLTFLYAVPRAAFVRLRLYDLLGREVGVLEEVDRPAGTYEMIVDVSGLPRGVYGYHLSAGATQYVGTVVIGP